MMKSQIVYLYLMYVNDFITVDGFAQYLQIDIDKASRIINIGRKLVNKGVK